MLPENILAFGERLRSIKFYITGRISSVVEYASVAGIAQVRFLYLAHIIRILSLTSDNTVMLLISNFIPILYHISYSSVRYDYMTLCR